MRAYVDEAHSASTEPQGRYILAASLLADEDAEGARRVLAALRRTGPKLHWRDEGDRRRLQVAQAVAEVPALHVVVNLTASTQMRVERMRRLCLIRLLIELDSLGVGRVVAESRGSADDGRDRALLDALRAQRALSSGLRLDHRPGPSEPLLWLPDVVCGVVRASLDGDHSFWSAVLDGERCAIELIEVN